MTSFLSCGFDSVVYFLFGLNVSSRCVSTAAFVLLAASVIRLIRPTWPRFTCPSCGTKRPVQGSRSIRMLPFVQTQTAFQCSKIKILFKTPQDYSSEPWLLCIHVDVRNGTCDSQTQLFWRVLSVANLRLDSNSSASKHGSHFWRVRSSFPDFSFTFRVTAAAPQFTAS